MGGPYTASETMVASSPGHPGTLRGCSCQEKKCEEGGGEGHGQDTVLARARFQMLGFIGRYIYSIYV
jgi:hypothetical protein